MIPLKQHLLHWIALIAFFGLAESASAAMACSPRPAEALSWGCCTLEPAIDCCCIGDPEPKADPLDLEGWPPIDRSPETEAAERSIPASLGCGSTLPCTCSASDPAAPPTRPESRPSHPRLEGGRDPLAGWNWPEDRPSSRSPITLQDHAAAPARTPLYLRLLHLLN